MITLFKIITPLIIFFVLIAKPLAAAEVAIINEREFETIINENKGKIIILHFFTLWFADCKQQTSASIDLNTYYANQKVTFVGLCLDNIKLQPLEEFAGQNKITYPLYIGSKQIYQGFDVHTFPTSYILDTDGDIFKTYRGYIDPETLKTAINDLLKET